MKNNAEMMKEYYKLTWCVKCRKELTKKELAKAKKTSFMRLCDTCYTPIKESLARCLPLMQKLKGI